MSFVLFRSFACPECIVLLQYLTCHHSDARGRGRADREGAGRHHYRLQELRNRPEGGHHQPEGPPLGHEDAGPQPHGTGDNRPDQQHR